MPDPDMPDATRRDVVTAGDREVILRAEETLEIGRRRVDTGGVRVAISTETTDESVEGDITATEVSVRRVPVGRVVETAPAPRTEGDTTILPVLEERLVVFTELVLVEEVHVTTTRRTERETLTVPVRRQVVTETTLSPLEETSDAPR